MKPQTQPAVSLGATDTRVYFVSKVEGRQCSGAVPLSAALLETKLAGFSSGEKSLFFFLFFSQSMCRTDSDDATHLPKSQSVPEATCGTPIRGTLVAVLTKSNVSSVGV